MHRVPRRHEDCEVRIQHLAKDSNEPFASAEGLLSALEVDKQTALLHGLDVHVAEVPERVQESLLLPTKHECVPAWNGGGVIRVTLQLSEPAEPSQSGMHLLLAI